MLQSKILNLLSTSAREVKEKISRRRRADVPVMIMAFRGDQPVAQVILDQGGRSQVTRKSRMVASVFDADSIGVITEAYQCGVDPETGTTYRKNPLTGQPWSHTGDLGAMQILAEEHHGVEKGWVLECVSVLAANRAGDIGMKNMPYRWVGKSSISWVEGFAVWDTTEGGGALVGGYVIEQILEGMNSPGFSEVMRGMDVDADQETRDLHAAYLLHCNGCRVLLYKDGEAHTMEFLTMPTPPS